MNVTDQCIMYYDDNYDNDDYNDMDDNDAVCLLMLVYTEPRVFPCRSALARALLLVLALAVHNSCLSFETLKN